MVFWFQTSTYLSIGRLYQNAIYGFRNHASFEPIRELRFKPIIELNYEPITGRHFENLPVFHMEVVRRRPLQRNKKYHRIGLRANLILD